MPPKADMFSVLPAEPPLWGFFFVVGLSKLRSAKGRVAPLQCKATGVGCVVGGFQIFTCRPLPGRPHFRYCASKALAIEWLCDDRGAGHLFMDAVDRIVVGVCSDEDDGYIAYLAKPSSSLDPFAASFEINIHQDDIGRILHCLQKGVLSVCH